MFKADDAYRKWLRELDEDVIQAEFGYERGEFNVYPEAWHPLYAEGLTPRQAWQRALEAHRSNRDEGRDAETSALYQERDAANCVQRSSVRKRNMGIRDRMAIAMVRKTAEHYGDPQPDNPDLSLTRLLVDAALAELPDALRDEIDHL